MFQPLIANRFYVDLRHISPTCICRVNKYLRMKFYIFHCFDFVKTIMLWKSWLIWISFWIFFVFSASISDGSWILVLSEDKEIYSEIQNIYLYYKNNIKYFNLHIVNSKLYSDGEDSQPSDLKSSALSRFVRIWLSDKGLLKKKDI